jgi:uncharacterized protein (DUF1697 family)
MTRTPPSRFVGLLRAVNVGGKNKIKMAELRKAMSESGLDNPQTYIQSGNLLFDSNKTPRQLEAKIAKLILSEFGHDVPVMVRDLSFIRKIVSRNPFQNLDASFLHAMILESKPKPADVNMIADLDFGDDRFQVSSDLIYIYCPNGYSNTKLTNRFFESKLKIASTTRNWRTINKLIAMGSA